MKIKQFLAIACVAIINVSCNEGAKSEGDDSETQTPNSMEEAQSMEQPAPQQPTASAEVSDEEMGQFMKVVMFAQSLQQSAQQEMMTEVENGGLGMEKFNAIQQSQQNPNQAADVSPDDMKLFEATQAKITEIQMNAQAQMDKQLKAEGISEQRYQEIGTAIQSNPDLMQKFQSMQQAAQGGNNMQQAPPQ
ncbi:MAG: DUF4168 domain-containing protein [Salibacteraceae bacterium]